MRRAPWAILLLGLTACALPRVTTGVKDCRLWNPEWDNPFSEHSRALKQPRLLYHLEYAALGYVTAAALSHVMGKREAAWTSYALLGIVPHTRSVLIMQRYPLTLDVAYDAVNRATPFVWLARQDTTRSALRATAVWLAMDLPLECWSSP